MIQLIQNLGDVKINELKKIKSIYLGEKDLEKKKKIIEDLRSLNQQVIKKNDIKYIYIIYKQFSFISKSFKQEEDVGQVVFLEELLNLINIFFDKLVNFDTSNFIKKIFKRTLNFFQKTNYQISLKKIVNILVQIDVNFLLYFYLNNKQDFNLLIRQIEGKDNFLKIKYYFQNNINNQYVLEIYFFVLEVNKEKQLKKLFDSEIFNLLINQIFTQFQEQNEIPGIFSNILNLISIIYNKYRIYEQFRFPDINLQRFLQILQNIEVNKLFLFYNNFQIDYKIVSFNQIRYEKNWGFVKFLYKFRKQKQIQQFLQADVNWDFMFYKIQKTEFSFQNYLKRKISENDLIEVAIIFLFKRNFLNLQQIQFCQKIFYFFYDEQQKTKYFVKKRPQYFCLTKKQKIQVKKQYLIYQSRNNNLYFYPNQEELKDIQNIQNIIFFQRQNSVFFNIYFKFQFYYDYIILLLSVLQLFIILTINKKFDIFFFIMQFFLIFQNLIFNFLLNKRFIGDFEDNPSVSIIEQNTLINNINLQFRKNIENIFLILVIICQRFHFIFFPIQILYQLKISLITKQLFFAIIQKFNLIVFMYFIIIIFVYIYAVLIKNLIQEEYFMLNCYESQVNCVIQILIFGLSDDSGLHNYFNYQEIQENQQYFYVSIIDLSFRAISTISQGILFGVIFDNFSKLKKEIWYILKYINGKCIFYLCQQNQNKNCLLGRHSFFQMIEYQIQNLTEN